MDRERSLFILTGHHGTTFCINCTNLARFAASFVQQQNGSKCTQTERNAPKHQFWVQWCESGASLRKIPTRLRDMKFCINCTSLACFAASFVQQQNGSKCTQTERNAPKHEFTVQWCGSGVSLRKIPTRLYGMNFCINFTSLARLAPNFVQQRNSPKSTRTERNTLKHKFRVQWCGSGAFVVTSSDANSWHELSH